MYADDIVLLSTCPAELQKMIDAFETYCNTWGLTVNLDKSKIIVFRKGSRIASTLRWTFQNRPIEIVNEYQYLGILLTYNMSFRKHLQLRLNTAISAINATWSRLIMDPKIDFRSKLKIFNAAAKSILLNGAQVWRFLRYDDVERLQKFFLKKVLLLPSNTPNYFLSLETGICSLYLSTLSLHLQYLKKVSSLPQSRLPQILASKSYQKQIFWADRLQNLYSRTGASLPNEWCLLDLNTTCNIILEMETESERLNQIVCAKSSSNHDLYHVLNYPVGSDVLCQVPLSQASLILKARGGLLKLNANPFIRSSSSLCMQPTSFRRHVSHYWLLPYLQQYKDSVFWEA